jgi:glycosyltransferase involved in cell wall biosynthesis
MVDLSIIVPVYNEAENVSPLVKRLDSAMKKAGISYEVVFVDDHSTDGTVAKVKSLKATYPITLLMKAGKKGKGFSILEGAAVAKADRLAMIDGDLQYPPEAI